MNLTPRTIFKIVGLVVLIILAIVLNPFSWNDAGYRTVVTQASGNQFVQYNPGMYYAGFFSKEAEWPNQISVSYRDSVPNLSLVDNTIEIGKVSIRFNDATTAKASGITQYILPASEKEMLEIHNAHRTPEALVTRRLSAYTSECLQNSAQLMSSEMHYGGGRAQMAQDYLDQLKNGAFLLSIRELNTYDSIEKTNKKVYLAQIQIDNTGKSKRKFSSIKEYGITVADAQITDTDYETAVDGMLQKKIAAATEASVSRQQLMTAQQQQLTAEAKGKQKLVEIEYAEKQKQTQQVVTAQTSVLLAEQDKQKQKIAMEAARLEADKIKTLADADAYAKQRAIQANGALEQKLEAYIEVQKVWANAASNSNWVPSTIIGNTGGGSFGPNTLMDMMMLHSAKQLGFDPSPKK